MRLLSLRRLSSEALRTLTRFPFVLAAAAAATAFALADIDLPGHAWRRSLTAAMLGLPLFTALALTLERGGASRRTHLLLGAAGAAALLLYGWLDRRWMEPVAWTRFLHLAVALHLFVAWLPWSGPGETNGFWQYNRVLFLRFLTAALYTVVLWAGLSGALAGVDRLLGIDVDGDTYVRLWVILAFLFNTWFFLAGVPEDLDALETRTDYPAGLKVFAQFVLVPIVSIYLVILTAYLGRILVTRTWPSGWIGWLVSGVAGLGILSLLLVHPVRERAENRWIPAYARLFWIVLLPSVVMLLLAIWKRIDQYGVTERRYFLVVLAVWLGAVAVWYALTRSRNLKPVPASLGFLALLTFGGPWGAYAVAERSQLGRLESLLSRHGMLESGRTRPAPASVPLEDRQEMSAVLRWLIETRDTGPIEPWFEGGLAAIDTIGTRGDAPSWRAPERAALILAHLGVEYVEPWRGRTPDHFFLAAEPGGEAIRIGGYTHAVHVRAPTDSALLEGRMLRIGLGKDSLSLVVRHDAEPLVTLPLAGVLERAMRGGGFPGAAALPAESLAVRAASEKAEAVLYLGSLTGWRTDDGTRVEGLTGELYLRLE